ncbi:MAG: alpha/beta hydrolase [Methylobacteriaceae bacterium]|nr:alpha/beta hydrolase [Methylobacteriaceae bacterium]
MLLPSGMLNIGSNELEYRMVGPPPQEAPTLVILHEGLGSAGQWADFPDRLATATNAGVFVYSRAGYGQSSPVPLPRPLTYMHDEALEVLPRLLDAIGFRRGILIGHSDGASIATIYAGSVQDHRIRGLSLIAPHFVVEDVSIASIAAAKQAYESADLRDKLARWHNNVDVTFRGWNDAWLNPAFRRWDIAESLAYIRVPLQIVQGAADRYGTLRQVEIAQDECYCPVDVTVLPGVGHAPHREAPDETLIAISDFVNRILHVHGEGALAA